jgi:hypothetical protein
VNASPIAPLVRGWVELYTRGVPAALRAARRDEIDDDLWCQHEEGTALGRSRRSLDAEMFLRLLVGMPADISWRMSNGSGAPASGAERRSPVSIRVIGALAILAGASWGTSVLMVLALGDAAWEGPSGPLAGALGVFGGCAFAAAAIGLIWRFQDRLSSVGGIGGVLAGLGVLVGVLGGYAAFVLLPIGSALLAWDLGRTGILSRALSIVHAASAVAFLAPLIASQIDWQGVMANGVLIGLAVPYVLSWMAMGATLVRGVPRALKPAAGA